MKGSAFSKAQFRDFVKKAKDKVGGEAAWSFISHGQREHAIAMVTVMVMMGQMGTADIATVTRDIYNGIMETAGMYED